MAFTSSFLESTLLAVRNKIIQSHCSNICLLLDILQSIEEIFHAVLELHAPGCLESPSINLLHSNVVLIWVRKFINHSLKVLKSILPNFSAQVSLFHATEYLVWTNLSLEHLKAFKRFNASISSFFTVLFFFCWMIHFHITFSTFFFSFL